MAIKDTNRKARANYLKKTTALNLVFYPTEEDIKTRLKERLAAGEAKSTYIKRLIREDIARGSCEQ